MVTTCNGGGWIVVDNNNEEHIYFVYDGNVVSVDRGYEITGASVHSEEMLIGKEKPIDRNHPHQCFQCKKPLRFSELIKRNLTYTYYWWIDPDDIEFYSNEHYQQYKHFKKLWKNKYVQFYCCACYQTNKPNIKGTKI